jgi:hypothetical protein
MHDGAGVYRHRTRTPTDRTLELHLPYVGPIPSRKTGRWIVLGFGDDTPSLLAHFVPVGTRLQTSYTRHPTSSDRPAVLSEVSGSRLARLYFDSFDGFHTRRLGGTLELPVRIRARVCGSITKHGASIGGEVTDVFLTFYTGCVLYRSM